MKAAPFAYERPSDLNAVLALMAKSGGVTKIMAGAAERGLLVVEGPGGSAIRPTDLLIRKFLEWAAMQFAFFTDSAIDAMKERAAGQKPQRPADPAQTMLNPLIK